MPEEKDNIPTAEAPEASPLPPAVVPEDLDAAHESLAKALRVCFVILKVIIFFMVVGYVLSGIYFVEQDEVAIALRFGKVIGDAQGIVREPGAHLNWPPPIGEVVRISTRVRKLDVSTFWPQVSEREKEEAAGDTKKGAEEFRKRSVDTAFEGAENAYFMTGDLSAVREGAKTEVRKNPTPNLLQARFTVNYTISKGGALDYFDNIRNEESEKALVKHCLESAVVRSAAKYGVFEILKDRPQAFRRDVRNALREALEQIRSGIEVQEVSMADPIPPKSVSGAFRDVLSAQMERTSRPKSAEAEMTRMLRGAAGEAGEELGNAILTLWDMEDRFAAEDYRRGEAVAAGDEKPLTDEERKKLEDERKKKLVEQRTEIDKAYAKASGEVEEILQEAETMRRRTRERARGLSERLTQLKETFRGQPEFLETERLRAIAKLLKYAEEKYFLVEKSSGEREVRLMISRHPDAIKRRSPSAR